VLRKICAVCGLDEMKIRVAAYMELGVQLSGRVIARSVSQAGMVGRILKGLGSLPAL
jgi:hypothetical protein